MTDANVVLGRLNPKYFLGGEIGLDVEGAARAIEERCAKPLGLSVTEAANGIVEIANAAMVNALHLISVQRGYDPRDFVLVGFGGAGPVHANALARDAEMPTLLIPRSPGIFSATGLLTTDLKRDTATTIMRRLDELDRSEVTATFARLEDAGRDELEREGLGAGSIEFLRQIDLRYVGGGARFEGVDAMRIASIVVPAANRFGGNKQTVAQAVGTIEESGGTEGFLDRLSKVAAVTTRSNLRPEALGSGAWTLPQGRGWGGLQFRGRDRWQGGFRGAQWSTGLFGLDPVQRLALEMALHEDAERAALEGELGELERAWQEAEEIAGISDNLLLPDSLTGALDKLRRKPERGSND